MPAKPLRMALGSLLIQKQYHYPDEELVEQIRENPYYQYFIGMPGYEDTTVYEQQRYMFENNIHTVENRIVRISQPYICPIVRGKAKSPVEFGAKLDLSVDETGMCRISMTCGIFTSPFFEIVSDMLP